MPGGRKESDIECRPHLLGHCWSLPLCPNGRDNKVPSCHHVSLLWPSVPLPHCSCYHCYTQSLKESFQWKSIFNNVKHLLANFSIFEDIQIWHRIMDGKRWRPRRVICHFGYLPESIPMKVCLGSKPTLEICLGMGCVCVCLFVSQSQRLNWKGSKLTG